MPKNLSIQVVSRMTGIPIHTIRAWEKRYQAVAPERTKNNVRMYSQADIERLKKLKILTELGSRISEVATFGEEKLGEVLTELYPDYEFLQAQRNELAVRRTLDTLKTALSLFDLEMLSHELSKIKIKFSPRDFGMKILHPILKEVGDLVAANELSIAQEHALSSMLKFHVGSILYQKNSLKKKSGKLFVLAAPEGELHEFGLIVASLLCHYFNHNFIYLGPNMPALALSETCNQIKADYLILGVSSSYTPDIRDYLNLLYSSFEAVPQVWLGGERFYEENFGWNNLTKVCSLEELDKKLSSV